jgi:two-component system, LuxR family, sensor kinase FixL
MIFRDEPLGEGTVLNRELRRLVALRWVAGVMIVACSLAGMELWPDAWLLGVGIGAAVLAYNAVFFAALRWFSRRAQGRTSGTSEPALPLWFAWAQIVLDLLCLAIGTAATDGRCGPAAGFFVLHMVLSTIVVPPRQSYLIAVIAIGFVAAALGIAGLIPQDALGLALWAAWAVVLVATRFLTGRIVGDARGHLARMRSQHEQLRAVLETAVEGIITIDPRGVILAANPASERIFGYAPGEIVGRRVNDLMPEPDRSRHDGYLAAYMKTGHAKIIGIGREVVGQRKDGTMVPLDLSISEVRVGESLLFTGIVRDISERKRAETEILTMNRELQRHQQALIQGEKMVAMGQMAAGIVHEIGNPLASMDSLLQLVQRHPERLGEETIHSLREQVGRIHRIVRQLTDFAHPNESAWEARKLVDLIQSTLEMMRFDRRLKGVRIERQLGEDVGEVRVMPHAFQQVLVNMIVNAVDAMSGVEQPLLILRTVRQGGSCIVEIQDNGHGIAAEHLPHVFEPFFTTKPIGRGTGLGLSISYSLIQRHGGTCEVESRLGVGTTFRILLPQFTADGVGPNG